MTNKTLSLSGLKSKGLSNHTLICWEDSGVLRTGSSVDRAVLVLSLRAYISRQVYYMNVKVGSKCNATLPTSKDAAN